MVMSSPLTLEYVKTPVWSKANTLPPPGGRTDASSKEYTFPPLLVITLTLGYNLRESWDWTISPSFECLAWSPMIPLVRSYLVSDWLTLLPPPTCDAWEYRGSMVGSIFWSSENRWASDFANWSIFALGIKCQTTSNSLKSGYVISKEPSAEVIGSTSPKARASFISKIPYRLSLVKICEP